MELRQDLKNSLLIIVSIVIAHFQLVFQIFYTKWDNLSAFFPYRYTANHFWSSGKLPLWDPYQNLGYPMHANPQGYVWYPITQFFSLFGEYTPYMLNLELVLHIVIASLGVYFLFKTLHISKLACLVGSISFGLSGFITGSSHMIGFTIAAAWLPWILLYFLLCLRSNKMKNYLIIAILGFLQLTGSYVAFSIILVYILVGIAIYQLYQRKIQRPYTKFLGLICISLPITLILCAPFLYSIYDSLPYFTRSTPLSYNINNFTRNFSWECFQSLLYPYINSSKEGFRDVDVSLANVYISFALFIASIGYVVKVKDQNKTILVISLIIFWLLSLGVHTPLHKLTFNVLPGFNLFRHPYLFNLYSTLLLVYMGCKYLSEHQLKLKKYTKIGLVVLTGIAVLSLLESDIIHYERFITSWINLQEQSPLNKYSHIILQSVMTLLLYSIYVFNKNGKVLLVIIITLDLIFSVQMNAPLNMYYNVPTSQINEHLNKISKTQLTNQQAQTPLVSIANTKIESTPGLWVNLNTFARTTGIDGYNPFIFKNLERINKKILLDSIGQYGVIKGDTSATNLVLGFNKINFDIQSVYSSNIVIQQNYHHNWTASLNGLPIKIFPNKYGLITFKTEGKTIGTVQLTYSSPLIFRLFLIAQILLVILTVLLVRFYCLGSRNKSHKV